MPAETENTAVTLSDSAPAFYMGDLDLETFEILLDDKIATGG